MYQSPDFIKVNVNISDSFASYGPCTMRSMALYTDGGTICNDVFQRNATLIELYPTQCYIDDLG